MNRLIDKVALITGGNTGIGRAVALAYDIELSRLAGIPVLDPVAVAVKVAESLVGLGVSHSKLRKFAHPPQPLENYL